jgi:hypothetical protein
VTRYGRGCAGDTFAGRVAGSLLQAIGLGELVTTSLEEYEALGLRLAQDIDLLRQFRARLAENRLSFPLFGTARSTRAPRSGLSPDVGNQKVREISDPFFDIAFGRLFAPLIPPHRPFSVGNAMAAGSTHCVIRGLASRGISG